MDLEARKISFVIEFLKIQKEEVVSRFENLLDLERATKGLDEFTPLTKEELNQRIDISEKDFEEGRFKTTDDLLAKYKR